MDGATRTRKPASRKVASAAGVPARRAPGKGEAAKALARSSAPRRRGRAEPIALAPPRCSPAAQLAVLAASPFFARLSRTGKIASMDEMPRLLSAALFGLKIDLLPVPPEELPQKSPNTTYFLVDTTHPFWQMIKNGRNIAVFSDLPSDSTVIKLFPVATQD